MSALRQDSIRFGPLERRLFLVVLTGLFPLAILSFATLVQNAQGQRKQLIDSAEDTMRAIVTAVDAELSMSIASLDALASSPRLMTRDFTGFFVEAKELLERRPGWANVVLSDPDANQLMNTRLPPGMALPSRVDPQSIANAVRTGRPGVGNMIFSPVLNIDAFSVRVPVKQDNKVAYVLTAVIRPESIRELLQRQRVPPEAVVGILDANQKIVARTRGHEEWVGKQASAGLVKQIRDGRPPGGAATTLTLEGMSVYSVFHTSSETGWTAAIGMPAQALDAPVTRSYAVLGGSLMLSVLIGLFAAFLIGRTITRPMRELEQAAVDVGQGRAPALPDTDLPEIREAAQALASAHVEREKLLQSEREARRLEQDARLLAENASKAKDEFLAMLGHELRNPLAAITTAAQVLDRVETSARPVPKEVGNQARAIISRQVQHLARLTDDLLDAGRVMMGKIHLERHPVELASIVQRAIDTLRNTGKLSEHDIALSLEPVWVQADAARIDQVVANLLTNAIKYTPAAGRIEVFVRREGADAVLCVRDTGVGLEPDLLPRVFDLFVQGRRSLDRSQGGLGIGLTLVRRLAELHGGSVQARSDGPGKGSEFSVRLPAMEAPDVVAAPEQPAATTVQHDIVIVEDNSDVRAGLRQLLEMEGHRVAEAADGPSGVETVLRTHADIALIDVGLPLLDGYGVAKAIRERAQHPVRLVAMTGYGSQQDIDRGLASGFDAYLVKPVDPALLGSVIAMQARARGVQDVPASG